MGVTEYIFIGIAIIIGLLALFKYWISTRSLHVASDIAKKVFPVWAAQGPFDNGTQSAAAMRYAYLAVLGPEETEKMTSAIEQHKNVYDSNSQKWEEVRQQSTQSSETDIDDYISLAKGLAAMDSLNKDILEDGGHRLEMTRQSDGRLGFAYKKIWSDEAIKEKKKQDGEAIVSGIGNGLLDDSSDKALELVEFLGEVYRANTNEEPESPSAIGRAWLACLEISNEEPDSVIALEFQRLNEAYQATKPDTDD